MTRSPLTHLARRFRRAAGVALASTLLLGATPMAPAQADAPPRVLARLQHDAAAAPEQTFRVLVGRAGHGAAADDYVTARGHRKVKDLGPVGFVAEVRGEDIAALGRHGAVRWVTIDAPVETTSSPVDSSNLGTVFNQTLETAGLWDQGITGQGVGIAILDTGIDDSRVDFRNSASRVVAKVNTSGSPATVADGYGHGTHVAGIAAGNSWPQSGSSPTRGKYVGVAPGASLISVRVSDDQGRAYLSDVIQGIEWVVANRQVYNIRVLNLSLQSTVAESASTSYLAAAVERAWLNGIFVVVAAGNQGPNSALYPPANDPFVVTVGASDPMSTVSRSDDGMAPWSSYGTTQEGYSKPDVVAPGRYIASSLASGSPTLKTQFPGRVVDGTYLWMSGTSVAAPQVAGLAALAFQRNPGLTNDALKWLFAYTATRLGGGSPLPGQGAGLVDANVAVTFGGTPGVANGGLRLNQHLVGPNGATVYRAQGPGGASWTEGGWDSTAWTEGGWDVATWSSATPQVAPWTTGPIE